MELHKILWDIDAWEDYLYWQSTSKKQRNELISLSRTPSEILFRD